MRNHSNWRLGMSLWVLAMAGVVVVAITTLPQLMARSPQQVPFSLAFTAAMVQSGLMTAIAVWGGVALSKPLGLGAPVIEAALAGSDPWQLLRRRLLPAAVVGALVGLQLGLARFVAPADVLAAGQAIRIPLAAKILYGGITEEVLMRWGVMTALVWLPWRWWQNRMGMPRRAYVVSAIVLAALLFALAHFPAAMGMGLSLTPSVVLYLIAGNAIPGVLFGWLYWRHGLETAMAAHALAHLSGHWLA